MSTDAEDRREAPAPSGEFLDDEELMTARSGIVSAIRERVERAGADGVVVGLSGGVDSTLSVVLAVEALGSDSVLGLNLPCNKTDRPDANEARTIAEGLGIEFQEVMVRSLFEEFEETIGAVLAPNSDRRVAGNATARLRMLCLYYAANARSLLVLGTANRTELLTGYFTKYGDGGADLFPLGGLYKTEVRDLAQHAGVPRRIVTKPSTAGFWAGQTDADELGSRYETIDPLLHRIVDEGKCIDAAIDDLPLQRSDALDLLDRCVDTSHKREMPPVYGVGDRGPVLRASRDAPTAVTDREGPTADDDPTSEETPRESAVGSTDRSSGRREASSWPDIADGFDQDLSSDALFRTLADERRQTVLDVLYCRGKATPLHVLTAAVLERTTDEPSSVPAEQFEQVSGELYHVHLPQLADAGLVDYDAESRLVRLTRFAERLRPIVTPLLA